MEPIYEFKDEYDFLSNFYPSNILWRGALWPTAEHLYQASKTQTVVDKACIREALTPAIAKKMGSRSGYKGFKIHLRPDWEEVDQYGIPFKVKVMFRIVQEKFTQNEDLRKQLLATGDRRLYEGNYWGDEFWGINLKTTQPTGLNWLGQILMQVRETLRKQRVA